MSGETCRVGGYWMLGIQKRGGIFAGVKRDCINFYIIKGSQLDNEENLKILREFLKSRYSYTLKIAYKQL